MSAQGVLVSDPILQSKFTQVELRGLQSKFNSIAENGKVTIADLPPIVAKLKGISDMYTEDDIRGVLEDSYPDLTHEIDFEFFLREYQMFQDKAKGQGSAFKRDSSMLRQSETTHVHTISESEKVSHITHINRHLADDPFLANFLPIDPASNQLFDLAKDGVLMCKLINVAVPGTIDEKAINTKAKLNPWERTENHTLCLDSAKAIGCTVVNIGTQDLVEGRPHLIMGLISQIIKIHVLADINLKKTPELMALVEENQDVEELASLTPEKVLLKWMNFQLKRSGYKKEVTNFSTDLKDGEAYAHLLGVLAPEYSNSELLETDDPTKRANLIVEQAEKLDCKGYISSKDITDGSTNLNLTFLAQIFQHRNGLPVNKKKNVLETSEEGKCFKVWISSLGTKANLYQFYHLYLAIGVLIASIMYLSIQRN